jgi:outer membrane protein TolC
LIFLAQHYPKIALAAVIVLLASCKAPSRPPVHDTALPVPPGLERAGAQGTVATRLGGSRYLRPGQTRIDLVPMRLIHLTFENSPAIKMAYLNFAGEKARNDYILATWTSTTPGFSVGPGWDRTEDATNTVNNHTTQKAESFLERNFLDTTRLRISSGLTNEDAIDAHAFHPMVGGLLHFPLWGSREALQRSSDQIFQQSRVNDAQLAYVQQVRDVLRNVVSTYFNNLRILQQGQAQVRLVEDLQAIGKRMDQANSQPADRQRIVAEVSTAATMARSLQASYTVEMEWLKSGIGLPFSMDVTLIENSFNPFGDLARDQLLSLSVRTDPEIATLQNAIKDAQVQLTLARKGRLDVAVDLGASADLAGTGDWASQTEYRAGGNLSVGFIDARISTSLAREAGANIAQYQYAIQRRNNEVYVDTIEPLIKARSLAKSIPEIQANITRYQRDAQAAVEEYFAGSLSVDDLVRRRQSLLDEENKLIDTKANLGQYMANLAAATGKYFELLQQETLP